MRIKLSINKSVHENAAKYYDLAKASRSKIAGLEKAIEETRKEISDASISKKAAVRLKRQKEWFEKFHNANTSGGRLMIGGRNAQQNDQLFAKYIDDDDLFFHADIQGGAAVILKDGMVASEDELKEAAQFAACFSNAWKNGNASVDVYAVKKSQISKHAQGGYIPTGAFAITGERRWFRGTRLALKIGKDQNGLRLLPEISAMHLSDPLAIVPSQAGKEKGALAKSLSKRYGVHPDELLEVLPNGKSKTLQR